MNILIFSWRGPNHPNAGGAEISTHEHAKGWIKAGHTVTLFTSSLKGAKSEETIEGVHIIRKGFEIFGVQLEAIKWYLFSKHPQYDIVIDEFHGIPFFTPLFVRKKKLAFIHEVAKEVWVLNPWPKPYNLIPAFFGTLFESSIFKLFYKNIPFMTVSESTKSDLKAWGIPENKIFVIHNGVNLPKNIKIFPKKHNSTLIFLGALSKDKGIEQALKTFSIVLRNNKNWSFWIIGKGEQDYLLKLKKISVDLGIEKNTKFFGFVKDKEKFELLSKGDILINTSIREGWGLVVIEAAAVGLPTIGFDSPGLRDSIKNGTTGFLCKQGDVNKLAQIVEDTMKNPKLLDKLSTNAYNWSKEFSWDKSSKASLKLIESL